MPTKPNTEKPADVVRAETAKRETLTTSAGDVGQPEPKPEPKLDH